MSSQHVTNKYGVIPVNMELVERGGEIVCPGLAAGQYTTGHVQ